MDHDTQIVIPSERVSMYGPCSRLTWFGYPCVGRAMSRWLRVCFWHWVRYA